MRRVLPLLIAAILASLVVVGLGCEEEEATPTPAPRTPTPARSS
ncbi:MAG TPA: hypothetical protein VNL95_02790 [Dehalococcoidia bacterium]|nr:hypothetical protein [Dehalococcoidia bacterium]